MFTEVYCAKSRSFDYLARIFHAFAMFIGKAAGVPLYACIASPDNAANEHLGRVRGVKFYR
jgi:hypothetical protein